MACLYSTQSSKWNVCCCSFWNISVCLWIVSTLLISGIDTRRLRTRTPGASSAGTLSCRDCDMRRCPLVTPETCNGLIFKDSCGCCPVCERRPTAPEPQSPETEGGEDSNNTFYGIIPNATASNACQKISCPRKQICILNIQGLPFCRCPTSLWCKRTERKPVCGKDGHTYKNRCFLKIAECEQNKKLRVAYKGNCSKLNKKIKPTETGISRRRQRKDRRQKKRQQRRRPRKNKNKKDGKRIKQYRFL